MRRKRAVRRKRRHLPAGPALTAATCVALAMLGLAALLASACTRTSATPKPTGRDASTSAAPIADASVVHEAAPLARAIAHLDGGGVDAEPVPERRYGLSGNEARRSQRAGVRMRPTLAYVVETPGAEPGAPPPIEHTYPFPEYTTRGLPAISPDRRTVAYFFADDRCCRTNAHAEHALLFLDVASGRQGSCSLSHTVWD